MLYLPDGSSGSRPASKVVTRGRFIRDRLDTVVGILEDMGLYPGVFKSPWNTKKGSPRFGLITRYSKRYWWTMLDRILYQFRNRPSLSPFYSAPTSLLTLGDHPFSDFIFYWRPDDQLAIEEVPEESLAAPYLEPGDIILAIDGKRSSSFSKHLHRVEQNILRIHHSKRREVFTATIPFLTTTTPIGTSFRLPTVILAFVFLLTGIIVIRFAQRITMLRFVLLISL